MTHIDSSISRLSAHEVSRRLEAGEPVFFIDVRRVPDDQHIHGSVRYEPELVMIAEYVILPVEQDATIVTYCSWAHEATSARVAMKLAEMGYCNVHALAGGYDAWRQAGLPLEERRRQRAVAPGS